MADTATGAWGAPDGTTVALRSDHALPEKALTASTWNAKAWWEGRSDSVRGEDTSG